MPYYPVTAKFTAALLASHNAVVKADAYLGGTLTMANVPIEDGTVTVDRGSKIRRTLQLTVADTTLLPWGPTDTLAVYGQQLVVQAGIQYPEGTTEWVPLGTFTIDTPSGDADGLAQFTLTGSSSELLLQDAPFTAATSTTGYSGCVEAITSLIHAILPSAVVVNLTADGRDPVLATQTWDVGTDRWDAITQIATSMSAEIGCDAQNRFVITDIPDPSTATIAVWDVTYGGTLMDDKRQMARANVYNGVRASGENTSDSAAPVSYLAVDSDTSSPTYWGGPFGQKLKTYSSSLLTTTAACTATATAMLRDAIAPNIAASVDVIPNPALDAGDIVRLVHGNGTKELCALQSMSFPLSVGGACTLTMRGNHTDDGGS